jgi:hypothetical protein
MQSTAESTMPLREPKMSMNYYLDDRGLNGKSSVGRYKKEVRERMDSRKECVGDRESSRRFCCKRVHFGENRLLMITVKIMLSISL